MRRRRLTIVVVAVATTLHPAVAHADDGVSGGGWIENHTPMVGISATERRTGDANQTTTTTDDDGGSSGSGTGISCVYEEVPGDQPVREPDGSRSRTSGSGSWYVERCMDRSGQEVSWNTVFVTNDASTPAPVQVDPEVVARQLVRRLPLSRPQVATSPPAGRDQLVGVPTWLWVRDAWEPQSVSASLGGVTVTVTATPRSVRWDMGTGDRVTCDGRGAAYDPSAPDSAQDTNCSYTYRRSSAEQPGERYRVSARVRWRVRWTANGIAGGGDLGSVTRSTGLSLRVAEGQALVTSGR